MPLDICPLPTSKGIRKLWINLLQSFLVLCNGFKHPRSSCGQNRRLHIIERNMEGLKLDTSGETVPERLSKKPDDEEQKTTKPLM